eukprot:TRINITY_DN1226_c0_g1_i9.p2 TRINITY_DN1226_c0_g1~~TRINITY_DN1226_c0_g1_i9.p2  ORF type:complete len:427 (-),score=60.73 TRINITY_DN1226_c0_g1_i9:954-2234(-)
MYRVVLSIFAFLLSTISGQSLANSSISISTYTPSVLEVANIQFALDLLRKSDLCPWNCVFSPYSITNVLGLLLAGVKNGGQTQTELLDALHLSDLTLQEVHQLQATHRQAINGANSDNVEITSANTIFVNELFNLTKKYTRHTRNYYSVTPQKMQFSDPNGVASRVNNWVSQQTNNKIKEILAPSSIGPDTVAVIANAIYFKGEWATMFDKTETIPETNFYIDTDTVVGVDMMHVEDTFCHKHMTEPKFDVIELPYSGNDISMVILKPYVPLNEATANIRASDLLINFLEFDTCEPASIYLPKFSVDLKVDLAQVLKAINVTRIFNPDEAELEQMVVNENCNEKELQAGFCPQLYVSQAVHEAKIEVDEEGTTAAASTVAAVQFESAILSQTPEYRMDSPFFFMLYHKETRCVLFMGQVVNPIEQM